MTIKNSYEYWTNIPMKDNHYNGDLFKYYPYYVKVFDAVNRSVSDLRAMENWCTKVCGNLEETNPNSPWQIFSECEGSTNEVYMFNCTVIFCFTNKEIAMRFRLIWA